MKRELLLPLPLLLLVFVLGLPGRGLGEKPPGQVVFEEQKCTKCHAVSALNIAKVEGGEEEEEEEELMEGEEEKDPPDLSGVGKDHDADWMSKFLLKEVRQEGKKHKKKFKGTDEELATVTEWLATLKHDVPE